MIAKSMFHEGVVTVVDGVMGSGKTDIAGLLMFLAKSADHPTCCNTKGKLPGVVQIGTDVELFRFIIEYGKGVLFLDEMNVVTTSKRAGSYVSMYIELLVALCRKLHLAVVFIIQRTGNLLPMIREMTTYELIKIDIDNMLVVTPDMEFQVSDIPSCTEYEMMFDTYAFSGFKFLIDIEALFQEMTDYSYEEAMDRIKALSDDDFRPYWRKDTTDEMFERLVNKKDRRR